MMFLTWSSDPKPKHSRAKPCYDKFDDKLRKPDHTGLAVVSIATPGLLLASSEYCWKLLKIIKRWVGYVLIDVVVCM